MPLGPLPLRSYTQTWETHQPPPWDQTYTQPLEPMPITALGGNSLGNLLLRRTILFFIRLHQSFFSFHPSILVSLIPFYLVALVTPPIVLYIVLFLRRVGIHWYH